MADAGLEEFLLGGHFQSDTKQFARDCSNRKWNRHDTGWLAKYSIEMPRKTLD
jgi:hypothetical protein